MRQYSFGVGGKGWEEFPKVAVGTSATPVLLSVVPFRREVAVDLRKGRGDWHTLSGEVCDKLEGAHGC